VGFIACIEIADFHRFSGTKRRRILYEEGLTQIIPFQGRITASPGTVTAEWNNSEFHTAPGA
jgi:hypothetical protein